MLNGLRSGIALNGHLVAVFCSLKETTGSEMRTRPNYLISIHKCSYDLSIKEHMMDLENRYFQKIKAHLENFCSMEDEAWAVLAKHSDLKSISKEESFVRTGDYCEDMAFVLSGIFQKYYLKENGQKFIKEFCPEKSLIGTYASFLTGEPSKFMIQALEDSTILKFDLGKVTKEIGHLASYERLRRNIAEMVFLKREKREYEFLCLKAKERYQSFLRDFPGLVDRVPQYLVSEYLGVTHITLNRIINAS